MKTLWLEMWIGDDNTIWCTQVFEGFLQGSERKGWYVFKGKEYVVMCKTPEPYEKARKMVYAYMRARKQGTVKKCSLLD